jgi:hypothetical protein
VVPLMSLLARERRSPEGERTAVESSHGGALSRILPGVTCVEHGDRSSDGGA